jgi:hypothetical protein
MSYSHWTHHNERFHDCVIGETDRIVAVHEPDGTWRIMMGLHGSAENASAPPLLITTFDDMSWDAVEPRIYKAVRDWSRDVIRSTNSIARNRAAHIDIHNPDVWLAEVKRIFWSTFELDEEDRPDREITAVLGAILDTFDFERRGPADVTPLPSVEGTDEGFRVRIPNVLVDSNEAHFIAFDILRKARMCTDENYDATRRQSTPRRYVTCAICGFKGDMISSPSQGDDVAASIYNVEGVWFIQGHYGSSHFDCERYRYIRNFPTERVDPVCDGCFQSIVDSGDVEQVKGNFP